MRQISNKKIFVGVGIGILSALFLLVSFFNHDIFPRDLHGTYSSGTGSNIVYFSVDQTKEDVFFYADQSHDIYIMGTIHHLENNLYELVCNNSDSKKIIETQTIFFQDNSFQVTISGVMEKFQKIDNIPIVFGDINQYH